MSLSKHLQPTTHSRPSYTIDPRPDLAEDSEKWTKLLQLAMNKHGEELAGILHGFRCGGTRLKRGRNGYVLRPDVDPTGTLAWPSMEEYEAMRDKYLTPCREEVTKLLKELN